VIGEAFSAAAATARPCAARPGRRRFPDRPWKEDSTLPPRNLYQDGTDAFLDLIKEMGDASHRTAAIVAVAMVDDALGHALLTRLIPLGKTWIDRVFDSADAPLGTFSAKIRLGYALGLYGPVTCGDLDRVRWIRNQFAHSSKRRSFDDKDVAERCMALITPTKIPPTAKTPDFSLESARSRYLSTCRYACLCFAKLSPSPPALPNVSERLP